MLSRSLTTLLWTGVLTAAVLVGAGLAGAATPCWKEVINDWYGNGRVDKVYPIHCYREAIENLPDDVQTYSSASEDIGRALQAAIRQERDALTPDEREAGVPGGEDLPTAGGGTESGEGGGPGPGQPSPPASGSSGEGEPPEGIFREALDKLGPKNVDSIPLPLLILAGLALLLLAAGSAGLIARRIQARRLRAQQGSPPEPTRPPPH